MPKPDSPYRYDRDGNVRCRVCGCTDLQPCEPPCSWAIDERGDLCSSCAQVAREVRAWLAGAHRPSRAALWREVASKVGGEVLAGLLTGGVR